MSGANRMAVDPAAFRAALSQFCTGVAVISTIADDDVRAMTVTAFSSVSLDPPMVLVCIREQARIDDAIRGSGRFAVSILSDRQEQVSRYFGRSPSSLTDFEFEPWEDLPVVADALAHLAVDVEEVIGGGDHNIFLGRVTATRVAAGEPLLHFRGGYRARTPQTCGEKALPATALKFQR